MLLIPYLAYSEGCVPKYSPKPPCYCGLPLSQRRIVGGVPALPYQYPWQVALFIIGPFSTDAFCGASLLSSDTVLTSAHCVESSNPNLYVGFPNGDVTMKNVTKVRASEVQLHPYYLREPNPDNDFAIIKLETPVIFDDSTQPICLPNPNQNYDDVLAEVTGWGVTEPNIYEQSDKLMTVNVTTMTNEKCQEMFDKDDILTSMICAADVGKDSCQGDSGGPLITLSEDGSHYSQIGITSWGIGCAATTPGVYSRITDQLYWIMKQVSGQTCAHPPI